MTDHDASPKEWTHAHSLRHGPHRLLKRRNQSTWPTKQAILKHHANRHTTLLPLYGYPSPSRSRTKRSHSSESKDDSDGVDVPSHGDVILEGLEDENSTESDVDESEDTMRRPGQRYDYHRFTSAPHETAIPPAVPVRPIIRSYSDVDFAHSPAQIHLAQQQQFNQLLLQHHQQQHQHDAAHSSHCATCLQLQSAAGAVPSPSATSHPSPLGGTSKLELGAPHSAQTMFSPYRPSRLLASNNTTPGTLLPPPNLALEQESGHHRRQSSLKQVPPSLGSPVSKSADPVLVTTPPPAPPPPIPPSQLMLPKWFLILLAILKETDGRDKIAKVVQYGGRTIGHILRRLPQLTWWTGLIWRSMQEGSLGRVLLAMKVLLFSSASSIAVAASSAATSAPSLAGALQSSYIADTATFAQKLSANPLYSGALSRLDVLTAALSSARRVIRVCKWSYTLPGWTKTFVEWRKQVQEGIERDMQRREQEEAEKERLEKEKVDGQSNGASSSSTALTVPVVQPAKSAPFRFSHPHPTHVWSRLPWLSSVELLDLSIAVATDCSDDLEWLSKYRLFPEGLGYTCGRIAMCLWFTTVVLDLALTARVIRHYRYQRGQLLIQISLARTDYDSGCVALQKHQSLREEKEYRRLARELKRSPFKVKRETLPATPNTADAGEQTGEVMVQPVASALDAAATEHNLHPPLSHNTMTDDSSSSHTSSWSVLSDATNGARGGLGDSSNDSSSGPSSRGSSSSASGSGVEVEAHNVPSDQLEQSRPAASIDEPPYLPRRRSLTHHHTATERCLDHAPHMSDDSSSDSDEENDQADTAHAATVDALHRLSDLHHQLTATNLSLGLQYLNFWKFVADLGCALPMALNVHKEWDGVVQTTGFVSGVLGLYKLAITIRPAS